MRDEAIKVPNIDAIGPPLSSREPNEIHHGCSNVLVKDTMNKRCLSTNLNHGDSKLNLQEGSPSARQTIRLMGNDLVVCKTSGESFAKTAQKHTGN